MHKQTIRVVYPTDNARMVLRIEENWDTNVEPVESTITDPKLPENTVDLILMVDVYHEFSHPWEMTQAMVKALKPMMNSISTTKPIAVGRHSGLRTSWNRLLS